MANASVQLGYDDSAVRAGFASLERRARATSSRVDQSLTITAGGKGAKGGGATRAVGNASLQIQDIAVQMQAGTKFSTIFAQQAPQLLSAFGPAGMIVGGIAAIGGALYSAGSAANSAFTEMIKGADATHASLTALATSGSIDQISDGLATAAANTTALADARKNLDSFSAKAATYFSPILGGDDMRQRTAKIDKAEADLATSKVAAEERALEVSKQQLQVAKLKADGSTKEAAQLEAQFKLQQELAKIEASSFTPEAKQQLRKDTIASADAEQKGADAAIAKESDRTAQTKEATLLNLAAMDAKVKGNDKLATQLQNELALRSRIASLVNEGFDPAQANAIAQKEQELQATPTREGGRIKGANAAKREAALDKLNAGGLAEFDRLRAGGSGERLNPAFGREKSLSAMVRPGGPMGRLNRDAASRAAAAQDKRDTRITAPQMETILANIEKKLTID